MRRQIKDLSYDALHSEDYTGSFTTRVLHVDAGLVVVHHTSIQEVVQSVLSAVTGGFARYVEVWEDGKPDPELTHDIVNHVRQQAKPPPA